MPCGDDQGRVALCLWGLSCCLIGGSTAVADTVEGQLSTDGHEAAVGISESLHACLSVGVGWVVFEADRGREGVPAGGLANALPDGVQGVTADDCVGRDA